VSDGTQSPSGGGSTRSRSATKTASTKAASTKAMRRAAMERAAAQRAKARHRRNLIISALAVVAVVGLVTVIAMNNGKAKKPANSASGAPSAGAAAFPQLPPGADPALKTKPAPTAGTGTLTKLVVTPIVQGTGAAVQAGQTITVNYVGVTYKDAKEFDSSWKNSAVASFPIGVGQVIPGWDQGLVGVKVGSRVQLDIPSELAYGDDGQIPGPLRFIVDILAAK
jgi:peptidylprolyl isomerase